MKWVYTALVIALLAAAAFLSMLTAQRAGADLSPFGYAQALQTIFNALGHGHTVAHCTVNPVGFSFRHYIITCVANHR